MRKALVLFAFILGACYYTVEGADYGSVDGQYRVKVTSLQDTCGEPAEPFWILVDVLDAGDWYTITLGNALVFNTRLDDGAFRWEQVGYVGWGVPAAILVEGTVRGGRFVAEFRYRQYDPATTQTDEDGKPIIVEGTEVCQMVLAMDGVKRYVSAQ